MSNDSKYITVDLSKPTKNTKYIQQLPYVGDDGIYVPLEAYVSEGCECSYECVMTKEIFVEAYNKWIKDK